MNTKLYTGKDLDDIGYIESTREYLDDTLFFITKSGNLTPHEMYDNGNGDYSFTNSIINNDKFLYSEFKHPTYFLRSGISTLGAMAYFVYTGDFIPELTLKYRKSYNGKYGSNYNEIVDANIENQDYQNLQINFIGKEGGSIKGLKNLELFFYLRGYFQKKELKRIYLISHYGEDSLQYNTYMETEYLEN